MAANDNLDTMARYRRTLRRAYWHGAGHAVLHMVIAAVILLLMSHCIAK